MEPTTDIVSQAPIIRNRLSHINSMLKQLKKLRLNMFMSIAL